MPILIILLLLAIIVGGGIYMVTSGMLADYIPAFGATDDVDEDENTPDVAPDVTTPDVTTPDVTTPDVSTPDVTTPSVDNTDVTTDPTTVDFATVLSQLNAPALAPLGNAIVAASNQVATNGSDSPLIHFFDDVATEGLGTSYTVEGITVTSYQNIADAQMMYVVDDGLGTTLEFAMDGTVVVFGVTGLNGYYGVDLATLMEDMENSPVPEIADLASQVDVSSAIALISASPEIIAVTAANLVELINSIPMDDLGMVDIIVAGNQISAQGYNVTLSVDLMTTFCYNMVEDLFAIPAVESAVALGLEMAATSAAEAGETFPAITATGAKELVLMAISSVDTSTIPSYSFQVYSDNDMLVMLSTVIEDVVFELSFPNADDMLSHISCRLYPTYMPDYAVVVDIVTTFTADGGFNCNAVINNGSTYTDVFSAFYDPTQAVDNLQFSADGETYAMTINTSNADVLNIGMDIEGASFDMNYLKGSELPTFPDVSNYTNVLTMTIDELQVLMLQLEMINS